MVPRLNWDHLTFIQLIDNICQSLDDTKTDEILADYLIGYKLQSDMDPAFSTFWDRWKTLRRQFTLRGLTFEKNNFPKTITALEERGQALRESKASFWRARFGQK